MGNLQTLPLKNYGFSLLPKSIQTLSDKPGDAYLHQLVKDDFQVPAYGLKSKTHLNSSNIRQKVYRKPEQITLLTYNVWFQDHNSQNRYECIMRMLAQSNADFICLQQVNNRFLNLLHQSSKLFEGEDYFMPVTKMHWYDTLILSKYPCRFYKKEYGVSGMGRCNLMAVVEFSQQNTNKTYKMAVNCTHLESLNSETQRIAQLQEIQVLNKGMDMSIVAGDFNFSDGWAQDKAIKQYTDVWKVGKRTHSQWSNEEMRQSGYTMPPTKLFPPWRPDHIIFKANSNNFKGQHEIAVIGDFTLPPFEQDHFTQVTQDSLVRTPSDHFGLISKIVLPS